MHGKYPAVLRTVLATIRSLVVASLLSAVALQAPFLNQPIPAEAAGRTYYLNCNNGRDGNSGLSQSQAWKSLDKANGASLGPGDSLLLLRDCVWQGTLRAKWFGTAADPVL